MEKPKTRKEVNEKYKWDLTRIYKDNNEVIEDINLTKELTKELLAMKEQLLANSNNLLKGTDLYFDINRKLEKLVVYSNLSLHEDLSNQDNQKLVGIIDKLVDETSLSLAFYIPEVLNGDYNLIKEYISKEIGLKTYEFFFEDLFREKEHTLSIKEEALLASLGETISSFSNVYDMLSDVDIKFKSIKDENLKRITLDESSYYRLIRSNDRRVRHDAFVNLYKGYKDLKSTYTEILKGSIKADTFIAKSRKYNSTLEMSLSSLNIDPKLYDVLISKTNKNLDLLHQYMSLRKNALNLEELHLYDLYCPMVENSNKKYTYDEARTLILKALSPLGDTYIKDLNNLFESRCVDVYHTLNKKSSAYSWGCYDALPYVLLNYEGTFNDVSTIAHEMGHAMHSFYSNKYQDYPNANYSLFLAEIASQTNEILLNSYCYENATSKEEKKIYLNNLLETIRTAFYRQVMFAEFEKIVHSMDESGEVLTTDNMCEIYYDLNKKYFGTDIVVDKEIAYEWIRISHFYRSFYVYMYATGISVACRIANDILNKKPNAKENYLKLLQSGGKTYSLDILKSTGIDIVNDDTIDQVFILFNKTLKEFSENL